MNTKGIKFLAVLAVMVMAFAAIVVLAPADNGNEAVVVYDNANVKTGIKEFSTSGSSYAVSEGEIYVADDATIKVKDALTGPVTIYVQNGKEINVDFKVEPGQPITIVTVTGDQQAKVWLDNPTTSEANNGKIVLDGTYYEDKSRGSTDPALNTSVTITGVKGQSVYYKAAVVDLDFDYVSTSGIHVNYLKGTAKALFGADKAFASAPETGKYVAVAAGQTVDVNDTVASSNMDYGARVVMAEGNGTVTTFYGVGDDIGTIRMAEGDEAEIKNATATLTLGTSTLKLTKVKGVTATAGADDQFSVSGTMTAGTANVTGKAASSLTITTGTVTIANKAVVSGTIVDNDTLIIKADATTFTATVTGTGKVVAQNTKLWNDTHDAIACVSGFTGLVDTYAISKVAQIKDDISTSKIASDQTFEVVANTTVYKALTIDGILIINEGVTLTVDEAQLIINAPENGPHYTQIINNGTIIVKSKVVEGKDSVPGVKFEGGYVENNGKFEFAAKNDFTATPSIISGVYKFVNSGAMKVSSKDAIVLGGTVNNKGSIEILGVLADDTDFSNSGIVTFGSNASVGEVTVTLTKGAALNINAVKLGEESLITVKNGTNTAVLGTFIAEGGQALGEDVVTVRNLTFVGASELAMDGNMTVSIPNNTDNKRFATITIGGKVSVLDSVAIPNHVKLSLSANTEYTAYGTATISDAVEIDLASKTLSMNVYGEVITMKGDLLSSAVYNGAKYSITDGTTIYTNFEDAIAGAYIAGIKAVIVGSYGPVFVTEDVTVPAEMSVDPFDANSMLIVGGLTPVAVTIEETGKINMPVEIAYGYLYAKDASDVYEDDITAHVKFGGEEDVTYASLDVALEMAMPGQRLVLINDFVMDGDDLVIPEGIIVDAINKDVVFAAIDSNLYVNGMLIVNEFWFVAETNDDLEFFIKGTVMEENNGVNLENKWFTPEGVSYTDTVLYDDEEKIFFVITDISNLQNAIDNADDAKVTVEGSPDLGDISVTGPDGQVAEITFKEDINAGTITMDDVIIKASDGAKIDATFANARGSIVITGAYVTEDKIFSIYAVDDGVVTMSGPITDTVDATYAISFYGETGMDDGVIGWGEYVPDEGAPSVYPAITFYGDTTVIGKKNAIMNTTDDSAIDDYTATVTVLGSLVADNSARIEIVADLDVLGALAAAEKTDKAAGLITIDGNIFVGITQAAVWDPTLVDKATNGARAPEYFGGPSVAAAAILSGKIDVADTTKVVVADGASVLCDFIEDFDSFDLLIDDDLYLTIYGKGTFYLDGFIVPVVNCDIDDVYDQDLNTVSKFSNEYRVLYDSKAITFGVTEWVNIGVDYDVFSVLIKTDGSVKAVYIDGILMYTGENRNTFELSGIATGTHKVTVEAATGYDADKCVLYTELGTILPGMAFTFTEYDCVIIDGINTHEVIYNINGTEIQPEPVPPTPEEESQWTITTILLVILVVLIAIMAVIVALRLNRS